MFGFLGRRLLSGVVLVFAITTLAFLLLYLGSGDIARRILGQTATHEQVAAKAAELGLDRPIWEQYVSWLSGALTGDLGRSWFSGQLVIDGVTNRLMVTLSLVIGATIITAVVAVVLGVLAALAGAEGQHVEVDADLAQQVAAAGALGGEVDARCGGHGMAFGRGRSAGRRRSGRVARF